MNQLEESAGKQDHGSCAARYGRLGEPSLPIFIDMRPLSHLDLLPQIKGSAKNGAKLVGNWDGFRRPLFGEAVKRYQSHIFTYIWIFRALFEFWRGRLRFLIRQIKVANIKQGPYCCTMSVEAAEFIEIFEALPVEKKIEVADFARFLFEKTDDDRWEQIVNGEKTRMKLEEYAQICEKEGSVLLDFEKL